MAAVLAVLTVLAAGLTVFPSSVQDAQANPCSNNINEGDAGRDTGGTQTGGIEVSSPIPSGGFNTITPQEQQICEFSGPVEFNED